MKLVLGRIKLPITLLALYTLSYFHISAQLDTQHWIPPAYSQNQAWLEQQYIYLSTPSEVPFPVRILDAACQTVIAEVTISNQNPGRFDVGGGETPIATSSANNINTVLQGKGYCLQASLPFYANLRILSNNQGGSLTAKGRIGAGTTFRTGQIIEYEGNAGRPRASYIGILALEDATNIRISDFPPETVFANNGQEDELIATLNQGETYIVGVNMNTPNVTPQSANALMGALVESTNGKPIVLSCGSILGAPEPQNQQDMGIDQPVPIEWVGDEYIVVKGNGGDVQERPIVIAHEDNTEVYVNGEANPIAVLNAGEYFPIPTVNYGANRGNMYVQTSNPAYMYQMLSSTDVNINLSLNFVPPINCFQPREVNNIASTDQIGNTIFSGGVILVTTTDAVLEVTDGNGVVNLPAATPVPGNAIFSTYRIDGLVGNVSVVSDGALQVGVFGQSGAIGWAGYYAGFPTDNPFLTSLSLGGGGDVCRDGSYLFVLGSEYDRYLWYRDGEFLVEEPTGSLFTGPYGGGEYTVQGVLDGCGQTSLSTAFEFECPDAFSCASTSAALWLSPESIVLSPANQLTGWGDISGNSFLQENPFALRNPGIFWATDGVENFYRTIALRENNFLESIPLNSSLLRRQGEISMFAVFNANNDGLVFSNGNPTNTQTGLSASRAFVGDNGTPLVFDTPVGQELSLVSTVRTGALAEAFLNGMANGNAALQVEEWIDAELTVGAQLSDANVPELLLDGNLAELIIFPTALDQAQREQVQSHLGIKYGFSLPHDLYSSAGDVLRTAGDPYANEVAAIAQDECANLDHKQSANRAPTALLTMGLGGIFPLNRVNPNDFPTDMSYLMWGHDNQALDITRPITGNDSVSCVAMARTWHVTEPLNPVPQVTLSIPDNLGVSFLITSPDEDFENGNETYYRLVDEGAGALTLEIDFPASQYITFGTETNSLTVSSDTTVCLGSSVMLEAAGAASYLWTSNSLNNIINAATPTPEVTVNETAFIYVQAQDDNGCILQDSVLINSFSSDAVNAGPDQSVCLGDSISLTATGAESYIWINIGRSTLPDQTVSPTTTTLYVVEGRDDNACVSYDSVEVSVAFIPEIQLADTVEACIGGEVSITASANTSLPLVWSTGEAGNTISFTAQIAQPFQVVATSELGCVDSATTFLQITEGPIAAFTADNEEDIEALAVAFTNLSQNATKYVWQFGDRTTSGQENPTHTYELVGEYEATLIALDDFGCSDTASLGPLRVNDIRIFAPSAFSPNGDGENDEYFVVTQGISDMSMKVFNRWGRQITEIEGVEVRWDGTAEGAIVPEGVYVGKISGVSSKKGKVLETTTIITIVR